MEQIADFMKQLYEHFYLEKNEIKKLQKNISSELLASFGRQLTETEDIPAQLNESVLNWDSYSKEGDACQEKIEKNEFPKIAGYKINIPFGAEWQWQKLTYSWKRGIIPKYAVNIG